MLLQMCLVCSHCEVSLAFQVTCPQLLEALTVKAITGTEQDHRLSTGERLSKKLNADVWNRKQLVRSHGLGALSSRHVCIKLVRRQWTHIQILHLSKHFDSLSMNSWLSCNAT